MNDRVLVVVPQGLGDSLEATPLVRGLRHAYPSAHVDVAITRTGPRILFESLPGYVDDVLYLPYWEQGPFAFLRELAGYRRRRRYELSFLAFPSARGIYALLIAAFPSRSRVAHRHAPHMLLDLAGMRATLVPVRQVHNVERNRDLLRAVGISPGSETEYLVPERWIAPASARSPRRIAVHIGSVAHDELALRRWPLEKFVALCRRLASEHEEVALVVGPDEREESEFLMRQVPTVAPFEGPLPEVARFLSTCAVVIANDSGIAHLAAGVGARTITLFGPTPVEHAPFATNAVVLRPSNCPPCFDVRRPIVRCVRGLDFRCLKEDLSVELVARAVGEAILAEA